MENFIDLYFLFLSKALQYDMAVYSQNWIYKWALIPAFAYTIFFIIKWFVLWMPITLPLSLIIKSFRLTKTIKKKTKKKNFKPAE